MSSEAFLHSLPSNPLRPVDWRWERAALLVTNKRNASRKRDDELTCRAVEFMRQSQRVGGEFGCRRVTRRYSDIVLALKFRQADPLVLVELESRVLARQPAELVAEHLEVPVVVVDAYKSYFFDVDDRIDASSYLVHQVLGGIAFGSSAPEEWMKVFAYHHGPAVIEPWLDYLRHRDETHDINTLEGWQRDSIEILLLAQDLIFEGSHGEHFLKCLPFIEGNWKKTGIFRSPSSVFLEIATQKLADLTWRESTAGVERAPKRRVKPLSGRIPKNRQSARAG